MLKHFLSSSTSPQHLPPPAPRSRQFVLLDPRLRQTPYLWRYSAGGTLRSDNFLRSSEAAEALRAAACRLPRSLPSGEALGLGSGGKPAASAGPAGGREPEPDLIKGRRPGGDQREGDTHLNNSEANKSFRLGSVRDARRG